MISYRQLFLTFFKIGAILLGGGYVILPILYDEFSEKRNLVSKDDITCYFTLSQTLPGIVAVNISIFIGYKLKGLLGAIMAVAGIISVPFLTIIILASLIGICMKSIALQGALWGIGIAMIALIMLTIREVWQNSKRDILFYAIFVPALLSLVYYKWSPIKVIIIFSVIGTIIESIRRKINDIS